jgi:SpoVK/Ycf46/Vps4 family AAA+-type ATPase
MIKSVLVARYSEIAADSEKNLGTFQTKAFFSTAEMEQRDLQQVCPSLFSSFQSQHDLILPLILL